MPKRQKGGRRHEKPLTTGEILQRDNVPAVEEVPAEIAGMVGSRIVLSSDDPKFDPRYFAKVKGSKGAWELTSKEPVIHGPRVERVERVAPGSLKRSARGQTGIEPSRPPWQSYVYHPKMVSGGVEGPSLRRKSGARVRAEAVWNYDDRELLWPDGYPWHCIGLVTLTLGSGAQTAGTGTLVGSRTVLCSAHMVPWGNVRGAQMQFAPGAFNSAIMPSVQRALGGGATSSFVTDVWGYSYTGRSAWDLAVLRLAVPLGAALGTMGVKTYDDDWEDDPVWTLVGYPAQWGYWTLPFSNLPLFASGQVPTRQFGVSVEDDDSDAGALELEHRADTSPGNSGGPLFGHWPKGPYVIGVHSGTVIDDGTFSTSFTNVAAGGPPLENLVRWARANWV
jgi:V8-like Glu-specific endopeptidase